MQGREKLGEMPTEASNIIKFLNSKSKYQLEEVGISDKTATILEVKKILTKRNLIEQWEERCETLELQVNKFTNKIKALIQRDCPTFM